MRSPSAFRDQSHSKPSGFMSLIPIAVANAVLSDVSQCTACWNAVKRRAAISLPIEKQHKDKSQMW